MPIQPPDVPTTPEPQQPEEGQQKGSEQTPKPKPEARLTTAGYRLETVGKVDLSPRQLLQWEGVFRAADVLKVRLQKAGIDSKDRVETPHLDTAVYEKEIQPLVLEIADIVNQHQPLTEQQLEEKVAKLRSMMDMESLLAQQSVHVVTITEQPEPEMDSDQVVETSESAENGIGPKRMETLFDIWTHDLKGKITGPKGMLQLLERKRNAIIQAGGDPSTDEDFQGRVQRAEEMFGRNMTDLDALLETGMPFSRYFPESTDKSTPGETLEELRTETQRAFPHEQVSASNIVAMIRDAIAASGQQINLHEDTLIKAIGSHIAVDWNLLWAQRMIENLISNAQKAHTDADIDPAAQVVDVFIGAEDGKLSLLLGDRGKGYPSDMVEAWSDPARRTQVKTGWAKKDIATTGLGLREHTAILEQQYGGDLTLYNWSPEGGAATWVTLPLINPPER